MILSADTIRRLNLVTPLIERGVVRGRSYGLSGCSVDIRVAETFYLDSGGFSLCSSMEQFKLPNNVAGFVKDKSSWARRGLSCFNTLLDPGWEGYLTIELVNQGFERLRITEGDPICQVVFQFLDQDTSPYKGKYNQQEAGAQEARFEV